MEYYSHNPSLIKYYIIKVIKNIYNYYKILVLDLLIFLTYNEVEGARRINYELSRNYIFN